MSGVSFDVLAVGARTFVKPPPALLPKLDTSAPADVLTDKWITGSDVTVLLIPIEG